MVVWFVHSKRFWLRIQNVSHRTYHIKDIYIYTFNNHYLYIILLPPTFWATKRPVPAPGYPVPFPNAGYMVCGYWCHILFLPAATCCLHYQTSNCQRNFFCQRDKNKYGATAMAAAIRWALSDCKWNAEIHWPLKLPLNNIWTHIGFICEPWKHIYKDIRFLDSPQNL